METKFNPFDKNKWGFYGIVLFMIIFIISLISTILLVRHKTVLVLHMIIVLLHIILIINSVMCIYLKKDAGEIYFMIMSIYITVFVLTTIGLLQTYKKFKDNQFYISSNKRRLLEITILVSVLAIIINVMLRNKDIVYVLNILLSIFMLASIIII